MTIRFSVALQLVLAVAFIPAMALADQITQLAPFDSAPTALSIGQTEPTGFHDRFLQEQKLERWQGQGIVVANASEPKKAAASTTGLIPGRGVVVKVDRTNATVTINHDPIPALDWPEMTMSFRLKESALADQVKEGDKVEFFLEKSGSDYVIVKFGKPASTKASP